MGHEQFEEKVRQFLYREPFQPFVAERLDGSVIAVRSPNFVLGGGGIAWIDGDRLVEINCEDVRDLRPTA